MRRFRLTIRRQEATNEVGFVVDAAEGVSLGTSPDGTAVVAILGEVDREVEAAKRAHDFVSARRNHAVCAKCAIGIIVIDHAAHTVTALAAPVANRQIYHSVTHSTFSAASDPRQIPSPAGQAPTVSADNLFRYVYFHMIPGPSSLYAGVSRLQGGYRIDWNGHQTYVKRYWHPEFQDHETYSEREEAIELHRILHESVGNALHAGRRPGAFLSGGLDSSTVAGVAAAKYPGIPTISMGFDAAGYDEMEFARIASRHFGTRPLEYYITPDDVETTLPSIAAAFPEPFGNSSAAAAYHCARIARERGIDLLMAGDGGDELFGGNERYSRQLVFEIYQRIPRSLRKGLLEPVVRIAGQVTSASLIGKARSYIDQANVALPDRLQSYNFLHRHDPSEVFESALLAQVDLAAPIQMLRDEYRVPNTDSHLNRMLFLDWRFTLQDNDLVKVNTMCDLAGVGVAYPMLDQALVDFSTRIPAEWKVRNGELRWFYKRAMANFLPREIIGKAKHGFGLPFGVWTRTHKGLRRLSEEALESLSGRGYFRPEFIHQALRLHREGHASYYGELVWILMVLEFWLQRHIPHARL